MKQAIFKSVMAVLVALFSLNAHAYDVEIDGIYYNLNKEANTAEVTEGSGTKYIGEVIIPESIVHEGVKYFVTTVGRNAFYYCGELSSITIPSSIISIEYDAFARCTGLNIVKISDLSAWCKIKSKTRFVNNYHLFLNGKEVKDLVIPNDVTNINNGLFSKCVSLTSLTIPSSVTEIGASAFEECSNLNSIIIPPSVTSIGIEAFTGTAWWANQEDGLIYTGNVAYKYKGTMPENTNITIKEGTTRINDYAFYLCSGLISITIPNSVISIGQSAFEGCEGISSIVIPNSVESIEYHAFRFCRNMKSVVIGNGVKYIGENAFGGCSNLTSINLPNCITEIDYGAFAGCSSLTSVTIPNSVTSISPYAFSGCI